MFTQAVPSACITSFGLENRGLATCDLHCNPTHEYSKHSLSDNDSANYNLNHTLDLPTSHLRAAQRPRTTKGSNSTYLNGLTGTPRLNNSTSFCPLCLHPSLLLFDMDCKVGRQLSPAVCYRHQPADNNLSARYLNSSPSGVLHAKPSNSFPENPKVHETGLSNPSCTCNLETQNGGASLQRCRCSFGNVNYELSEDLRAKEIEMTERCYGGRLRAQRAARIIQNVYREYRLRSEYAKIRLERCTNRIGVSKRGPNTFALATQPLHSTAGVPVSDQSTLKPSQSLEDVVLEQAYIDWASRAATEQATCSAPLPVDATRTAVAERISTDSGFTPSSSEHTLESSNASSVSLKSEGMRIPHSGSLNQSTPLGSDCLLADGTSSVSTSNLQPSVDCPCNSQLLGGTPLNGEQLPLTSHDLQFRVNPARNLSSPTLSRKLISHGQRSSTGLSIPSGQLVCASKRGVSATPEFTSFQLTRVPNSELRPTKESEPSSVNVRHLSCCHCPKSQTVHPQTSKGLFVHHPSSFYPTTTTGRHYVLAKNPSLSDRVFTRAASQGYKPTIDTTARLCSRPMLITVPSLSAHPGIGRVRNLSNAQRQSSQLSPESGLFLTTSRCPVAPPRHASHSLPTMAHLQATASHQAKQHARQLEKKRKRLYRIGLNLFNKSSLKGIEFLIRCNFLDRSPETIARFLLTRKGLSRAAIGDYLGNLRDELAIATTRQFMRELDFREQEVDEALRALLSCFRTPGESQKIVHLLTEFQSAYIEQNSARVKAQFRNPDSVMVLAYAIVMLHTDMHSPNIRPRSKMTRDEFVRNLRGVDDGGDLDRNLLLSIYSRIQSREMTVLPDHTDQVRKIQQHLTGPNRPINLALPHRRLVCYCRLYEVPDKNKKERVGAHQREVFLFNDLLLLTKAVQKKRRDAAIAYQVRLSFSLSGLRLVTFENQYYPHGLELVLPFTEPNTIDGSSSPMTPNHRGPIIVALNTKTLSDRTRFMEDLQECILEVMEMDRFRIEEEIAKQLQQKTKQGSSGCAHIDPPACKGFPKPLLNTVVTTSGCCQITSPRCLSTHNDSQHTVVHEGYDPSAVVKSYFSCPNGICSRKGAPAHGFGISSNSHPTPYCITSLAMRDKSASAPVEDDQRLSGDSGLLADLDTPPSNNSRILSPPSSFSSS